MRLTEHERERLLITLAADVAERRRGRGTRQLDELCARARG